MVKYKVVQKFMLMLKEICFVRQKSIFKYIKKNIYRSEEAADS